MYICDKCKAQIMDGARFCPQCGDPVTEADKVVELELMDAIPSVELSFGYSSSPNYIKAIEIVKKLPVYESSGEGKGATHKINLPITEIELLINLFELVGSWKTSQMLINGQRATKANLVYHGAGCFRNRQKAYKRDQYCYGESSYEFNIWGCKKINLPIYEWGGGWLQYGAMDKKGAWHFDKKRIRHELELGIHENSLCPVLNKQRILKVLDMIPDAIDPKKDRNWEYVTDQKWDDNGNMTEIATGIKPVIKKMNEYVVGTYKPDFEDRQTQPAQATITIDISRQVSEDNKQLDDKKSEEDGVVSKLRKFFS